MPNFPKLLGCVHADSAQDGLGPCLFVDAGEVVMVDVDRHPIPNLYDLAIATPKSIWL